MRRAPTGGRTPPTATSSRSPAPGTVPTCAEAGVIGALPGIMGSLQAMEVIKLVCGIGEPLVGRLLMVDTLAMRFETVRYKAGRR